MLLTFCIVSFAWIFFRADNFSDAATIISKIFTDHGPLFMDKTTMLLASIALVIVLLKDVRDEYHVGIKLLNSKYMVVRYLTAVAMICYILACGVLNGGSFIYFQF